MAENSLLYVIDASVLIKWFIIEVEDRQQALKIKEDHVNKIIQLVMPSACLYETLNTLGRKTPAMAPLILSEILMLNIEEYHLNLENSCRALSIMQKFSGVSFYDASYHAIAIENNGIFVTADENYYKKTKSLKHIKLLKDYV